jgi:hypothetical protein
MVIIDACIHTSAVRIRRSFVRVVLAVELIRDSVWTFLPSASVPSVIAVSMSLLP